MTDGSLASSETMRRRGAAFARSRMRTALWVGENTEPTTETPALVCEGSRS